MPIFPTHPESGMSADRLRDFLAQAKVATLKRFERIFPRLLARVRDRRPVLFGGRRVSPFAFGAQASDVLPRAYVKDQLPYAMRAFYRVRSSLFSRDVGKQLFDRRAVPRFAFKSAADLAFDFSDLVHVLPF